MRAYVRQLVPAVRMLLVLTAVLGVLYPLAVAAIAQLPGLVDRADGSLIHKNGAVVGSGLIGQSFTDSKGRAVLKYFQSRPSAGSYDPTASGASNLGPESVVDKPGSPSLLTQVCARSVSIGKTYGVDGSRPFCADGVGAVLAVFYAGPGYGGAVTKVVSVNQFCPARPFVSSYQGTPVQCASRTADYSRGKVVPIRGSAPAHPAVPADAVTASGSGIDPEISPDFARLQEAVVARARGIAVAQVDKLVRRYEKGRDLGFLGEARVNVLRLNLALDARFPAP